MPEDRGSNSDASTSTVDVSEAVQFAESFPATDAGGDAHNNDLPLLLLAHPAALS